MRKQLIALSIALISMSAMAQKNELKTAEKAIKKKNYVGAKAAITSAEALIGNMDAKLKSKFYFLKAQAYKGTKDYRIAAESFQKLMSFEKETGKKRYTDKAAPMLNAIISEVSTKAIKLYSEEKDYKNATENFYLTYLLSPVDTTFLYNAAVSAQLAEDYDNSLKHYRELKDIKYTAITTQYFATNKETGLEENLGSKAQRNLMLKSGNYTSPTDKKTDSKQASIIKNIGYILTQQGKTDEAIIAVKEARLQSPKDLNLLLTEADLYIKLKQMDKFGELMQEAVKLDPTNPTLFFNLGVVNFNEKNIDEAKKYYQKAIELKPDYGDAYMNMAVAVLSEEQAIIDDMNENLSNFKKYDALEIKQKELYKEALPFLEKADGIKRDLESVRGLLNIYETLEMEEKAVVYRALYKELKG